MTAPKQRVPRASVGVPPLRYRAVPSSAVVGLKQRVRQPRLNTRITQFLTEAERDSTTVAALRTRLDGIEPIPLLAGYSAVEAKAMTAHEVRVLVQQLREKYAAAADADGKVRAPARGGYCASESPCAAGLKAKTPPEGGGYVSPAAV